MLLYVVARVGLPIICSSLWDHEFWWQLYCDNILCEWVSDTLLAEGQAILLLSFCLQSLGYLLGHHFLNFL